MEQYDYDIDQSLRVISGASNARREDESGSSADLPSTDSNTVGKGARLSQQTSSSLSTSVKSSTAASVSDYGDGKLTLNTRRRLIRKPLPDVPSLQKRDVGGTSTDVQGRSDGIVRHHELQEASHSSVFAYREQRQSKKVGVTLSQARQRTRDLEDKERSMLEWWPSVPYDMACKSHGESQETKLNARCRRHLRNIIHASLQAALPGTDTDVVLNLTASIELAIVACLDSVATPSTLAALHRTCSILWRVEALIRSEEQLKDSKGGIANVLDLLGLRWTSFVPWRKGANSAVEDNSIKALTSLEELLSIRPLLVSRRLSSSNSVNATVNTEQRRRKRDVAMQLLNSAFLIPAQSSTDLTTGVLGSEKPQTQKKITLAGPSFALKPVTPTVALATKDKDHSYFPQQQSQPPATPKSHEGDVNERPSMLADRLSMQLRNASRPDSETTVPHVKASTLRDSSARSSRTSINMMTESQARESLTLMACSIYHLHEEQNVDDDTGRPSRANTIKGTLKRLENLSTISGSSDDTVKGSAKLIDEIEEKTKAACYPFVEWMPDRYEGCLLRHNPFSLTADVAEQKTDETIAKSKLVGGTFITRGSAQHYEAVNETMELALYAAISMLLETNFLFDFGLRPTMEEDKEVAEVVQGTQLHAETNKIFHEEEAPKDSDFTTSQTSRHSPSHWHRGIWHVFGQHENTNKSSIRIDGGPSSPTRDRPGSLSRMRRLWHAFAPSSTATNAERRTELPANAVSLHDPSIDEINYSDLSDKRDKDEREQPATVEDAKPSHISAYRGVSDDLDVGGDLRTRLKSSSMFEYATVYGVALAGAHPASAKKDNSNTANQTDSRAPSQTFSATHPPAANTWSTLSGKSDGTNVSTLAGTPSVVTTSPLESASNSRSVRFYEHDDIPHADTSLGQALEEMAARTTALQHTTMMKMDKSRGSNARDGEVSGHTFKIAQYLAKRDKVFACGSVIPRPTTAAQPPPSRSGTSTPLHGPRDSAVMNEKIEIDVSTKEWDHSGIGDNKTASLHPPTGMVRPIQMWHADVRTGRQSVPITMSNATYLASYAMFIEALTNRAEFTTQSPPLIGDDLDDTDALGESDDPKHDLVRMFKIGDILLKFHVQSVTLFDLLIEGPVVLTHTPRSEIEKHHSEVVATVQLVELHTTTRAEIQTFYASLKRCVSQLEQIFVARELDANGKTIRLEAPSLGRSSVRSVFTDSTDADTESVDGSVAESTSTAYTGAAAEPLSRLERVSASIRKGEFDLYEMLENSDPDHINDVRARFCDLAGSAKKRLRAWSCKHLSKAELGHLGDLVFDEPEYFGDGKFAFPGSRYLLRKDEPLSIIAYSLSSREYKKELASASKEATHAEVRNWRMSVTSVFPHHDPFPVLPVAAVNVGSEKDAESPKLKTEQLDPDLDEIFAKPEPLRISTKRKKRLKEASMLSLRIRSSAATVDGDEEHRDQQEDESDRASQTDQSVEASTVGSVRDRSDSSRTIQRASECSDTSAQETKSILLKSSAGGADTVLDTDVERTPQPSRLLPAARETVSVKPYGDLTPSRPQTKIGGGAAAPHVRSKASPHVKHTLVSGSLKISCVSWFAEEFAKLRQQWGVEQDFVASLSRSKMWSNLGGKSKSGFFLSGDDKWIAKQLLNIWTVDEKEAFLEFAPAYLQYMTNSVVNDCPTLLVKIAGVYSLKIKDVKTNEVKLKLSVQVLENVFSGDFGETIRFDLKGIRERRALVSAPKKGSTDAVDAQHKAGGDPVITQPPPPPPPSVWWDGEWIETMAPRAYVKEANKILFERALHNDLSFLTASKMMDYSLLVGVNEDKSGGRPASFHVRIVDFLGAWTLVKQLESSGKKAIKSHTPTVIPPHEYADRFRKAMSSYFIGSPSN